MATKHISLAEMQTLSGPVHSRWKAMQILIEEQTRCANTPKQPGQKQQHRPVGHVEAGSEGHGSGGPDHICPPIRQRASRLSSDQRLSWRSFLGNALSVGRAVRFSSCEAPGWDVDDYDNLDRSVDMASRRGR